MTAPTPPEVREAAVVEETSTVRAALAPQAGDGAR